MTNILAYISKRLDQLSKEQIAARTVLNDLESTKYNFRIAQNVIIETSARVAELSLIHREILTQNRAQS